MKVSKIKQAPHQKPYKTVNLEPKLYLKFQIKCLERGLKPKELIESMIDQWCKQPKQIAS